VNTIKREQTLTSPWKGSFLSENEITRNSLFLFWESLMHLYILIVGFKNLFLTSEAGQFGHIEENLDKPRRS
jgi:hypothetical protein